jgi:hypothetical protein
MNLFILIGVTQKKARARKTDDNYGCVQHYEIQSIDVARCSSQVWHLPGTNPQSTSVD